MNKPEKAGTDDLKRMLRRLERIETEKAERSQARSNGPVRTRDLSSLPEAKRRADIAPDESLVELAQSPRRKTLASSLDQIAPEPPILAVPPRIPDQLSDQLKEQHKEAERKRVSVLTDPREFTKRGGPKRQGVSAGFVILTVSVAFLATLGTIWLSGGFDRVLLQHALQGAERFGKAGNAGPESEAPRIVAGGRIAPDEGPAAETDPAPDHVLAPPPSTAAEGEARAVVDRPAPSASDTDEIGPPPAPVAALQPPQETALSTPLDPVDPASLELVSPGSVSTRPGVPLSFPLSLKAGPGDLSGYYLVVSGLKRGSVFSSGIELLFDTWQIPATSLSGLQLTTKPGFARRMNLNVELRGPSGDRLKRTTLIVELPGAARSTVGLDGPDASGDRPVSEAAQELIDKAEVFLDNGSLQGARMLLERAASYGAGYAAMLLATSYDPQYAEHFSAGNPQPDAALAKRWYQRASELGVSAAGQRLNSVNAP
jgi:hypothetical protein